MTRARCIGFAGAVLTAGIGAWVPACDGVGEDSLVVEVTVSYPIESLRNATSSLHFWLLEPRRSDYLDGGCDWLVSGERDPYDLGYERHADFVVTEPGAISGSSGPVPRRWSFVYAEAVGYDGEVAWSGCAELEPSGSTAYIAIPLVTPGSYDCSKRDVEDRAPCDDGLYCTIGERCVDGECVHGSTRSCAELVSACHVGKCNETTGCHPEPLPNGWSCEDGSFCTIGEWCEDGECVGGSAQDCSGAGGACRQAYCDEARDLCLWEPDDSMACDDGNYCTVDDACDGGACVGAAVDCSYATNDCNFGYCSETLLGGCAQAPINELGTCDTNCIAGGTCQAGVCEGGTPTGVVATEGPAGDATCSDFLDNDCDTYFDADDPDCAE